MTVALRDGWVFRSHTHRSYHYHEDGVEVMIYASGVDEYDSPDLWVVQAYDHPAGVRRFLGNCEFGALDDAKTFSEALIDSADNRNKMLTDHRNRFQQR